MKIQSLLFLCLLLTNLGNAQTCNLSFTGTVVDDHNDLPLAGAVVELDTEIKITDSQGRFEFKNLCKGEFNVRISHVACNEYQTTILLEKSISKSFYLEHHVALIEEITIERTAREAEEAKDISIITADDIKGKQSGGFGQLIEDVEGVQLLKTGATISKPVINGLHSQRILLVNQGIRMEGQQWGLEHAPEIDAFAVNQIQVIKGAGSVEFGSDGLGGVIIVKPNPLTDNYGVHIEPTLGYSTNGKAGTAALSIAGKQKFLNLPLSFQLQGSLKKVGNLKTPTYYLDNSGVNEQNFSIRAGYVGDKFGSSFKVSQFNSELGILTDSHIGNQDDLLAIIENGRPFLDRGFSYEIQRPRQDILHEIMQLDGYYHSPIGTFTAEFARQYNTRAEFDRSNSEPGLNLKTETYVANVNLTPTVKQNWFGKIGLQGLSQQYRANGFYLIPEYETYAFGIYGFANKELSEKLFLEAGARYDYKTYDYQLPPQEFRRLTTNFLSPEQLSSDIVALSKSFNQLFTGSAGATYSVNDQLTTSAYLGFGARPPLPNELFSDGVHHGTALWEIGNPFADVERSTITQVNAQYEGNFKLSVNAYYNYINNYTYLLPQQDLDPIYTIRGTFPVHETVQTEASFTGINYQIAKQLNSPFELKTSGTFLWASDQQLKEPLLYAAPNRLQAIVKYNQPTWHVQLQAQQHFEQKRIPNETIIKDYTRPPKGYRLINLSTSKTVDVFQMPLNLNVAVDNLLNTSYKNYLDRFRYFAENQGINFTIQITYKIN